MDNIVLAQFWPIGAAVQNRFTSLDDTYVANKKVPELNTRAKNRYRPNIDYLTNCFCLN